MPTVNGTFRLDCDLRLGRLSRSIASHQTHEAELILPKLLAPQGVISALAQAEPAGVVEPSSFVSVKRQAKLLGACRRTDNPLHRDSCREGVGADPGTRMLAQVSCIHL